MHSTAFLWLKLLLVFRLFSSRYYFILQCKHISVHTHITCLQFKILPRKLQHPTLTIQSCRCDLQL